MRLSSLFIVFAIAVGEPLLLCRGESPAGAQQTQMSLHLASSGLESRRRLPGKKKPKAPGRKGEIRRRPVSLGRCLDACAAGGEVFIRFCNDIESPATRAACYSKAGESEQQCRGFCSNYFRS